MNPQQQHTYWQSHGSPSPNFVRKSQQSQPPIPVVHIVPQQQCYYNYFPQAQQPVYQYYYGVPIVAQQPQYAPLPRNDHQRRRSMEEISRRKMSASHRIPSMNTISSYRTTIVNTSSPPTPLHHSQSVGAFPRAASRHSIATSDPRNPPLRRHSSSPGYHHGNALRRSTTSMTDQRPVSAYMPRGRLSSDRSRTNNGLARRAVRMASIAEDEERRLSLEDEVPLAMLANQKTIPAMKKCQSIQMESRCNSNSTNSSRPSFTSKSSSSGESSVTSNCSSIHNSLSPPSLPQPPQRRRSMAKRLFSSMHRFSKAVISPAK